MLHFYSFFDGAEQLIEWLKWHSEIDKKIWMDNSQGDKIAYGMLLLSDVVALLDVPRTFAFDYVSPSLTFWSGPKQLQCLFHPFVYKQTRSLTNLMIHWLFFLKPIMNRIQESRVNFVIFYWIVNRYVNVWI